MSSLRSTLSDPIAMIRDLRQNAPKPLNLWGQALNFPQLIGGVIFIGKPMGFWVLTAWIVSMIAAGRIYRLRGLSPWISLCHFPWLTLMPFLIMALVPFEASLFSFWLLYVTLTIAASLVMDFRAVYMALSDRIPAIYEGAQS